MHSPSLPHSPALPASLFPVTHLLPPLSLLSLPRFFLTTTTSNLIDHFPFTYLLPNLFPPPAAGAGAGAEGLGVHFFSQQELSQTEKQLVSSAYIKESRYLCQTYDLAWLDLYITQASILTPEEYGWVQAATGQYTEQTHLVDNTVPVGGTVVRAMEPHWQCQPSWFKMATRGGVSWSTGSFKE